MAVRRRQLHLGYSSISRQLCDAQSCGRRKHGADTPTPLPMATAESQLNLKRYRVPADGTRADKLRNGDFGTSPFLGSSSDKSPLR